ncbi:MAG: YhdP family protein [Woeseiaceae bacterium]|nr:YhdP family protein [Woeseiaceae bacterium]
MKSLLQKLLKIVAYSAAAVVILLAIAVGLFRLFLPRLPEYQEEIKTWASEAIGMHVEFSGMDARWGLSGPELEFYDTELVRPDNNKRAIAAEVVSVGISLTNLIFDRSFVVDRVAIQDTAIEVRQLDDGGWWIQGTEPGDLNRAQGDGPQRLLDMEIVGEDIEIRFLQPGDQRPRRFQVRSAQVSIDERRIAFDADVRLPDDLGRQMAVSATQVLSLPPEERGWDVSLEMDDVDLAGWSDLQWATEREIYSGQGDLDLALVVNGRKVRSAAAEIDFEDVVLEEGQPFDVAGRLELDLADDGWLAAAEEFTLTTTEHEWPETSIRVEASTDSEGAISILDVRASYLHLADAAMAMPLLTPEQRSQLDAFSPSGVVRDLDATFSNLNADNRYFELSVDLEDVGFAAGEKRPGVRGFTGRVRGDLSGGRIEIDAANMSLDLPAVMTTAIPIETLQGMLIWRSSGELTRLTTDSVYLLSPVMEMRGSGELSLYADRPAPEIDFNGSYSIGDVSQVYPYLPHKIMKPKLRNWFETALVAGTIPRGTVRMRGPVDKNFFKGDDGRLLVEGSVRGLTMKFQPQWPAIVRGDVEVVLDHRRLYSVRNRVATAGNIAVDSHVEIANLREGVLTIKALTTGTLETFRQYGLQSPLNNLMGGNLERLTMDGDASFQFDLMVPLKRAKETTINGVLRSNNGSLVIEGFPAPLEDLIGEVQVTRDTLTSENLGARFLGEDISIRLGPNDDPRVFTVASATGVATAEAVVNELGLPLEGIIEGATPYEARILFPRGKQEPKQPLTVEVDSDLEGLALQLPDPVGKAADELLPLRGDLRFVPDVDVLETTGMAGDQIAWQAAFNKPENDAWDFDRGVITLGEAAVEPAETRGLHIRGNTTTVRLEDWLNLSRSGAEEIGAADRIRSIELVVDDLFAVGQHLKGHYVRLDRSARDWLVQIEGENIVGSVFVPYDFDADRAMVIEAQRMRLPGDEVSPESVSTLDPRSLPPITLVAEEFALGDRNLGSVEAVLNRTEFGLESETLIAKDETFEIVGDGRWVADENEELGSRTYLTATLTSLDVRTTLSRLDFAQGISGKSMGLLFDLSWGGGPRANFLDVLDGEVQLRLENGSLEEVEPGAGRVLGLVSFVALPRRLSLDFRDVFSKGFRYDTIAGTFNVEDGIAKTCDMFMEGTAADIGIVGQVNMATAEYEQGAVISAKVGNTLPIVGAVVGGPPGAAAMLIFSQIFKKPLQEVGQVFYGISGPWEEPVIESVGSDGFVRYGELAGCLPVEEQQ